MRTWPTADRAVGTTCDLLVVHDCMNHSIGVSVDIAAVHSASRLGCVEMANYSSKEIVRGLTQFRHIVRIARVMLENVSQGHLRILCACV